MAHYSGRVTIIHHNADVARFCEQYFRSRNFYPLCCAHTADALGALLQTSFGSLDLLILDREVACSRGFELQSRLQHHRPDFPILLIVLPEDLALIERGLTALIPIELAETESEKERDFFETEAEYTR